MKTTSKAFTLIELLVVIAIIGLLASIVLVSFRGQREKAELTKGLEFSAQLGRIMGANAVGWWDFEEGSGTIAKDSSGHGNDGTISLATYTTDTPYSAAGISGGSKYALSFDGDDLVTVPHRSSFVGLNSITVSAWVKLNNTNVQRIVDKGWNGPGSFLLFVENSKFTFGVINSRGGDYRAKANFIPKINTWYHLTGVFDGNRVMIYVNGKLSASTPTSGSGFLTTTSNLTISTPGFGAFNGLIDEVRIYSRALSSAEIQKLYAEGLPYHQLAER